MLQLKRNIFFVNDPKKIAAKFLLPTYCVAIKRGGAKTADSNDIFPHPGQKSITSHQRSVAVDL
jgi:hypothetical protein